MPNAEEVVRPRIHPEEDLPHDRDRVHVIDGDRGAAGGFSDLLRSGCRRRLRRYDRAWFRADLAAGITLAAYLLPAALGDASSEPVRRVIRDLSPSPRVDVAGARLIIALHEVRKNHGITLELAEPRSTVPDLLQTEGGEEKLGRRIDRFTSLADAIFG